MKAIWYTIKNIPKLYLTFRRELKDMKQQEKDIATYGGLEILLRHFEEAVNTEIPDEMKAIYLSELMRVYNDMDYNEKDEVHVSALKKYCKDYNVEYIRRDG
tara:strand:+ start:3455 stop:3760 length:306 start_codon:yes stop_codon:yes gene_type:complete